MKLFELFATLGLDTSDFDKGVNESTAKGKTLGETLGGKLAGGAKALAKGMAVAGVAATTALTAISTKALNLGGELEQNLGGAESVFKGFAGAVETQGKEAFKNLGLATSDYLATANKMGALFQGAGFGIEESMDLSTKAMQRAADVASIMGIDTSVAMESIAGAAKGNFTMMDNLGVAMNDTAIGAYALSKGIQKSTSDMTQQEKIGLAMEMFLEKTSYAAGNYAKENETLAGSLSTAKAALSNFLSGAGDADSVVESFANAGDVIVKNLGEIVPRLVTGLTTIVQKLAPKIPPLVKKLLPSIIQGATGIMQGLVAALPSLTSALADVLPGILQGAKDIVQGFVAVLPDVISTLTTMLPDIVRALVDLIPVLIPALIQSFVILMEALAVQLPVLIPIVVDALLNGFLALIGNADLLIDAGLALLEGLFVGIVQAVPVIVAKLPEIIGKLVAAIGQAFDSMIHVGANILASIWTGMTGQETTAEEIKGYFAGMWNAVKGSMQLAADAGAGILAFIWNGITGDTKSPEEIKTAFSTLWDSAKGSIDAAIEAGSEAFTTILAALNGDQASQESIRNAFQAMWDSVGQAAEKVWGDIVSWINHAIAAVKEFLDLDKEAHKDPGKSGFTPDNKPLGLAGEQGGTQPWKGYQQATGLSYVPYNEYPANLHKGEAVLTRLQAAEWRKGTGNTQPAGFDMGGLSQALAAALSGVRVMMDGEPVGVLITPTVSIAMGSAENRRRYMP